MVYVDMLIENWIRGDSAQKILPLILFESGFTGFSGFSG
jgi:hypothetical protein